MYYRVKPKSSRRITLFDDPDFETDTPAIYPIVVDDTPDVDTGLVDDDGNAIMRRDRVALGFLAEHDE